MKQLFHFEVGPARPTNGSCGRTLLMLLVCAGATGCRHKLPLYHIPAAAMMSVEDTTMSDDESTIQSMPLPDYGPFPTTPAVPPAPRRRPAAPKEDVQPTTPPAEVASPDLGIGSLSTGVDATPQIHVQTQEMISSITRRIGRLPGHTAEEQRSNISRVRNFLTQAQQALNTGDIDGAKNLATKAGVLMDDVEKH